MERSHFIPYFFLLRHQIAPRHCIEYILWNVDENEWNGCNAQSTTKPTIKNVYTRNARSDEIVLIFHADTCNTGSWHNILLLYAIQLCEASKLLQWSPVSMFMSLLFMSGISSSYGGFSFLIIALVIGLGIIGGSTAQVGLGPDVGGMRRSTRGKTRQIHDHIAISIFFWVPP